MRGHNSAARRKRETHVGKRRRPAGGTPSRWRASAEALGRARGVSRPAAPGLHCCWGLPRLGSKPTGTPAQDGQGIRRGRRGLGADQPTNSQGAKARMKESVCVRVGSQCSDHLGHGNDEGRAWDECRYGAKQLCNGKYHV
jgi:hypothetical protein